LHPFRLQQCKPTTFTTNNTISGQQWRRAPFRIQLITITLKKFKTEMQSFQRR